MLETRAAGGAGEIDEYRLVRPLGDRPDSSTFLAHDRLLDRAVVLRLLEATSGVAADRLAAARALARVSHPNLCAVHRVRGGPDRPYVVSSFVRGEPLDAFAVPMPDDRVLQIARALAGALATLHAAGVAYGLVRSDRIIVAADGTPRFVGLGGARAHAGPDALRRDVRALVGLLERLAGDDLRPRLAELSGDDGYAPSAEELLGSLDALGHRAVAEEPLDRNPYRGLRPFGGEHAALFFGRSAEIAEARTRLAAAPWLVVAGRSGSGKSSFVHAGVVPAVRDAGLGERPRWDVATVVPGARPIEALASALAPVLGGEARALASELRTHPARAAALACARADAGLLLVVDPVEEAWTLSDPRERALFFDVIERFGVVTPGVRVLLTMRSDHLERLGDLGALGRDLLRSTLLLPPLVGPALREVISAPAHALGYEVEGGVLDALIEEAGAGEALPMLSFALAELWPRRDRVRRVVPVEALRELGSASAALARHGDLILAALGEEERREARRLLVTLSTRARCTGCELLAPGGRAAPAALDALVRGRLVVAGETYGIAHASIGRVWPRLRAWLDEASDARSAVARLSAAARDWERAGRREDALWNERQMRELEAPHTLEALGTDAAARAFLAASRRAVRAARLTRAAVLIGAPLGAALVALAAFGARAHNERRDAAIVVARHLAEAAAASREAADVDAEVSGARRDAFARFDADDWEGGEARWREARELSRREADRFAAALDAANLALGIDPDSAAARASAANLATRWLLVAERDHQRALVSELRSRLARVDDGSHAAMLEAPAHLRVMTPAAGARLALRRVHVAPGGRHVEEEGSAIDPGARVELAPGSYVVEASAPGRAPARLPLLLGRGDDEAVDLPLPEAGRAPAGFVFVPAGVSRLGSPDVEAVRHGLGAQPEHPVFVGAFLIGEHEVTFGEYLAFLGSLPVADREAHRPRGQGVELVFAPDGTPTLTLGHASARAGEPLCRPKRSERRCQDWLRLPVVGPRWDDARAYVGWLAATSVPGARLCTDREWERAARGADGREFPGGDVLHPGDANFVETYAADAERLGVDEVGSFPFDRSPFGVIDLAGNVTEWVADSTHADRPDMRVARGGAWSDEVLVARAACREEEPDRRRNDILGVRVCVSY